MAFNSVAFTGPRFISFEEQKKIWSLIKDLSPENWLAGDAPGVDSFIKESAEILRKNLKIFYVAGTRKYHFAERSKRMIDSLDGILYAFPNKDCPPECYPGSKSWGGSGTWGTMAYARSKGLPICLCPLKEIEIPSWYIKTEIPIQLKLF